jgi:hypothetical protein
MMLFNSTNEIIPAVGMALMQEKMTQFGVPCSTSLLEGSEHGSEYLLSALPGTVEFFRGVFSPDAAAALDEAHETLDHQLNGIAPNRSSGMHYPSTDAHV